jgi:hypothetical protein
LAVGLLLPAWLEYDDVAQTHALTLQRVEQLQQRLVAYERQIQHIQNDPAYIERLARGEFAPTGAGQVDLPPAPFEPGADGEFAEWLQRAARHEPSVSVFVLPETRPLVMSCAAGMLAMAIGVFAWSDRRRELAPPGRPPVR